MQAFLSRFTSRTFWITVGTIILMVTNEQYSEAAGVAIAYVLGEKGLDAVQTRSGVKTHYEASPEFEDVDTSKVVTGVGRIRAHDEDEE